MWINVKKVQSTIIAMLGGGDIERIMKTIPIGGIGREKEKDR